MLVDLRDRLRAQGELPALPPRLARRGGPALGVRRPVLRRLPGGRPGGRTGNSFELALVDVSGKGAGAGTRALLLSGALGGLLGAMPPGEFLRGGQRLPAAAALGGGVRDRRARHDRPAHRRRSRSTAPATRPPCTSSPGRAAGRCSSARERAAAGRAAGRDVHRARRPAGPRRRAAALHRRRRRGPHQRPVGRASTGCSARPTCWSPTASAAAPSGSSSCARAGETDDRACVLHLARPVPSQLALSRRSGPRRGTSARSRTTWSPRTRCTASNRSHISPALACRSQTRSPGPQVASSLAAQRGLHLAGALGAQQRAARPARSAAAAASARRARTRCSRRRTPSRSAGAGGARPAGRTTPTAGW